ncbi:SbtR family transcriptional regulator [Streptomyces sp. A1-5]|uniref:SbtR family transcriptional regulator n=1 Tax=Streptomyces sp. A1-5 TaxID=2738410 RepID=UPI001F25190B|nr:hypothetical protein [Streptomyces sp. A1-5]UJB45957.1 hypothetical protein HRD51_38975 [Streptomyces sp. A1-5]
MAREPSPETTTPGTGRAPESVDRQQRHHDGDDRRPTGDHDGAVDALQQFSDSLHPLLVRAQEAGEVRDDLTEADIPHCLVMGIAGLALPGTTASMRARSVALLFDSLHPAHATPCPRCGTTSARISATPSVGSSAGRSDTRRRAVPPLTHVRAGGPGAPTARRQP